MKLCLNDKNVHKISEQLGIHTMYVDTEDKTLVIKHDSKSFRIPQGEVIVLLESTGKIISLNEREIEELKGNFFSI